MQYLIRTASDAEDLERCENLLEARGAFVSTTLDRGVNVVEGHGPDDNPVIVVYPATPLAPGAGMTSLPSRIDAC